MWVRWFYGLTATDSQSQEGFFSKCLKFAENGQILQAVRCPYLDTFLKMMPFKDKWK